MSVRGGWLIHKYITLTNKNFKDLNPLFMGYEHCQPGKIGESASYSDTCTMIHYVECGKGVLYKNGNAYVVNPGDAFIILKGEKCSYVADEEKPWHYIWIGFDGELSKKFSELDPVFKVAPGIFQEMIATNNAPWSREYHLAAMLFNLYADLFSTGAQTNYYVREVQEYIFYNFNSDIKIESLAKMVNLDRKYLAYIFKKETGQTMQRYLLERRLYVAKWRLEIGKSITETAFCSGFNSVSNFSRMFKKYYGVSPGEWRKRLK